MVSLIGIVLNDVLSITRLSILRLKRRRRPCSAWRELALNNKTLNSEIETKYIPRDLERIGAPFLSITRLSILRLKHRNSDRRRSRYGPLNNKTLNSEIETQSQRLTDEFLLALNNKTLNSEIET